MNPETSYADGTLHVSCVYDAPRADVFAAWIEASRLEQWWGCANTTHVQSEVEPCVGGKYLHHMTVTGAGEMDMGGAITEYDPPARLAYTMDGGPGGGMRVSVDFIDLGERTEVRLVHENLPGQYSGYVEAGWTAGLTRLGRLLAGEPTGRQARPLAA